MRVVAKSDLSTGNNVFASYVLQSNDLVRSAGTASLPSTFACLPAAHTLVPSKSARQVHVSAAPVAGALVQCLGAPLLSTPLPLSCHRLTPLVGGALTGAVRLFMPRLGFSVLNWLFVVFSATALSTLQLEPFYDALTGTYLLV